MISKYTEKYRELPLAAKAAFWFMLCSFLQKSILAITTPLFARLMSTEQYGQFTIYMSWSNILIIIATLKLDDSVFNVGMTKYKDRRDEYVSTMQIITIIITTILLSVFLLFHTRISRFIGLSDYIVGLMIVELYANSAVYYWNRRKRYEYQYKPVLYRIVGMTSMSTLAGIIMVLNMSEKGYGRILSCIIINLLFGIGILIYNLKTGKGFFVPEFAKFALLFNLPLIAHYLSIYILDQFDRIMIQKIDGFSSAALYSMAYHIGRILTMFTISMNNALTPWMYEKLEERDVFSIQRIIILIISITCFISVCLVAIGPEVIYIFGGKKYQEAKYVIPPIALGMIFQLLYLIFANIEFYYEKNKAAMFMSGFAALLDIVLNYYGIKLYGYTAAAYTTLFCYIVLFALHYIYANNCIVAALGNNTHISILKLIIPLVGTVVCIWLLVFLFSYRVIRITVVLICVSLAFVFRSRFKNIVSTLRK